VYRAKPKPQPTLAPTRWNTSRSDDLFYTLIAPFGRAILLVDRIDGDPLPAHADTPLLPAPQCLPLLDPMFEHTPDRAPLLVELLLDQPDHMALLDWSIARSRQEATSDDGRRAICAWLLTDVSLECVQRELTQRLDARMSDGTGIFLRYFDPRVMAQLRRVLSPLPRIPPVPCSSLADLLGPVHIWCQLGREGHWLRHDNRAPSGDAVGAPLQFDESTAAFMGRFGAINQAAKKLADNGHAHGHQLDELIEKHMLVAQSEGLLKLPDQLAYAWRATAYGDLFLQHPSLPQAFKTALQRGVPMNTTLDYCIPASHLVVAPV
jgi:hypothetical protein